MVHFNEDKLFALEQMTRLLASSGAQDPFGSGGVAAGSHAGTQTDEDGDDFAATYDSATNLLLSPSQRPGSIFPGWQTPTKGSSSPKKPAAASPPPQSAVEESSKLLMLQFCVTDMSVELQSQGKSIAELQVTGVRASLTRRPFDTNVTMSVHSLLLVDALQVYCLYVQKRKS